jgi:GNAT superfamily N-acetyltransferase
MTIRLCRADERATIHSIVNAAAEAYRGKIPSDCFHEPYMSREELDREISDGVVFWGCEIAGDLVGVMGIQPVKDVTLVRHAYVKPDAQGSGIGGQLLAHLETLAKGRVLIGTWSDATWAIRFYERHGYALVPRERTADVLKRYWAIGPRQIETSVVLEKRGNLKER